MTYHDIKLQLTEMEILMIKRALLDHSHLLDHPKESLHRTDETNMSSEYMELAVYFNRLLKSEGLEVDRFKKHSLIATI